METKPLLFGLIGFFIGGLLVSVVATMDKQVDTSGEMTMTSMTDDLRTKQGDDFDKAFLSYMVAHHQAAVDMAKLSDSRAKHQEVKDLSAAIVEAQEKEIKDMHDWQRQWGYGMMDHASGAH